MAGGVLENFLAAVVRRLCTANLRALIQSLLSVVAHLVTKDPNGLLTFLSTLPMEGGQGGVALGPVMEVIVTYCNQTQKILPNLSMPHSD